MVWASPVCTHYSRARTTAKTPRDLVWADSLVLRALEIIEYFKPRYWFIESPQKGLLKTRPLMLDLPYTDVDTAIGEIRREPESGLIAGIRAGCAWALAAVPLWREDGTEHPHSDGVGCFRGSATSNITASSSCIESPTSCAHQWQCT